jgi:hypothetical protein
MTGSPPSPAANVLAHRRPAIPTGQRTAGHATHSRITKKGGCQISGRLMNGYGKHPFKHMAQTRQTQARAPAILARALMMASNAPHLQ